MICTLCAAMSFRQSGIDAALAARYFEEARWAARDDGGALWGRSLDGPMIFVNPQTRAAVASEAPPSETFEKRGEVYVGVLPNELLIANTAVDWHGRKWSMVMWPLPDTRVERTRLMLHELWHRIQGELGLPKVSVSNVQLDTLQGRLWVQMEVRALRNAMLTDGKERNRAIRDALLFRAERQRRFPKAKAEEDRMEVHEGLAEFTGVMLEGTDEAERRYALGYRLGRFGERSSFPSSFAYETGPAYGLLLNALITGANRKDWQRALTTQSSLADMTARLVGFHQGGNLSNEAKQVARQYGYDVLLASETKRERDRAEREASYRKKLVDGPVLRLPLAQMSISFDPNAAFPLGDLGTVHPRPTISDVWGTIVVTGGALMAADFRNAYVPAPGAPDALTGDGWTLTLKPGWRLQREGKPGSYVLARG